MRKSRKTLIKIDRKYANKGMYSVIIVERGKCIFNFFFSLFQNEVSRKENTEKKKNTYTEDEKKKKKKVNEIGKLKSPKH